MIALLAFLVGRSLYTRVWLRSVGNSRLGRQVTHALLVAAVPPGPAKAVIKHEEAVSLPQLRNDFGTRRRSAAKRRRPGKHAFGGFGIVRRDYLPDERHVGEISPVSVECGVRQVGRTG